MKEIKSIGMVLFWILVLFGLLDMVGQICTSGEFRLIRSFLGIFFPR